jgi:hypothetical protein
MLNALRQAVAEAVTRLYGRVGVRSRVPQAVGMLAKQLSGAHAGVRSQYGDEVVKVVEVDEEEKAVEVGLESEELTKVEREVIVTELTRVVDASAVVEELVRAELEPTSVVVLELS